MKIVHVCMSAPYIDGWGYQENLLPQYMAEAGTDVTVVASNILPEYQNRDTVPIGEYYFGSVKVVRIPCKRIGSSLTFTKNLMNTLVKEHPDAIFHHNLNFPSHFICNKYCVNNNVKLFVDNHADYINCVPSKLKRLIFYRCLNGFITRCFSKSVFKFYGVTHSRCDFLINEYGIPASKVDFLPIGADVKAATLSVSKAELRQKYGISQNDICIITGGKMGVDKGTCSLINAIISLRRDYQNLKLIVFGKCTDSCTEDLISKSDFILSEGWCDRSKTMELLSLADLACWPIHHTTLCEDAIACITPLLIRKTGTTEHLIDGNGYFLQSGDESELKQSILAYLELSEQEMVRLSERSKIMREKLSYSTLANQIIEIVDGQK